MAPSASASRIVYRSMNSPKISCVRFLAPIRIGVPVNPIRAQFGRPTWRVACRSPAWLRCASSTSTRMLSSSFNTSLR